MDRTNYVNKAKNLLLRTARTSALVIVPLAAAVTASATTISGLPTGNFACTTFSGPCNGGASAIVHSGSLSGTSLYTTGDTNIGYTSGGGMNFNISLSAYGPFLGSLPSSIPVDWDFTINAPDGINVTSWSLLFELSSTAVGDNNLGSVTEVGNGTGEFTGADTLTLASASPSNLYETAVLTVDTNGSGFGFVTANILQGGSADFNGAPVTSGAPEPASVGLFAAGLAAMGALLRRRKA
jgi:hypothetical protein